MALSYAFMLNPRRKPRRNATHKSRRRKATRKCRSGKVTTAGRCGKSWKACMKAARGDASYASRLYRAKKGCSSMRRAKKGRRKTLYARARKFVSTKRRGRLTWKQAMKMAGGRSKAASRLYRSKSGVPLHKRKSVRRRRRRKNPIGRATVAVRSNPRRRRRRRNTKKYGVRKTARRAFTGRRKRRKRRNPVRARRRPVRRRRNPTMKASWARIRRLLTDPKQLTQFAVGATGMAVSEAVGGFIHAKILGMVGEKGAATIGVTTTGGRVLGGVLKIAVGAIIASFLPSRFQSSYILGAGIGAVQPIVKQVLDPVLEPLGLKGYISDVEMHSIPGISGYIALDQAQRLGLSGSRGLGREYTWQQGQEHAFTM